MTPPPGAAAFLDAHGWGGAQILPVAGDASFRRYFRAVLGDQRAILMDAPPPHEDPRPFIAIAQWLVAHGFAAPEILASDLTHGLVLLEDFGDDRLREAVDAAPADELSLYMPAIDLLVRLRTQPAGPVPPYDRAVLKREAALFVEWYCPAVGIAPDLAGWDAAWEAVFDHAVPETPVTVLRDYHAENLMLVGSERSLGLLDFQDALAGHPAYDLVSLLQDARRDVDPAVEAAMLAHYRAAADAGFDAGEDFMNAYHVLGAQRNAKILGIFTRLWKRDEKPHYATMCPRVWRYLERDLAQPVMAPVATWFAANIPADRRGDPMARGA
ncbi:aminoglycoside phosphotransferase [Sphingomonas sp. UV9]|uniref:aminoglycoside phosphotransferase family protein n=1 Tax=Sphingomonas sp. UV9 TaxID=1851410 RepID=UPI000FFB3588|nr:phosphotransferase [Sphingomonas sp. UV9]RXD07666.1 aminoglycoside phosphotransferase [Sphingomonas sp. UV9]